MERDYTSGTDVTGVTFFVGTEIEHTPAYGKRTLFVVGIQEVGEILELANNNSCTHVYLGANQSFKLEGEHGTTEEQAGWDAMVKGVTESNNMWVTLDFDIEYLDWINESGYTENNNFIPMISVKVPYIEQLGYNACIKIDDIDFNATNKGVWTHSVHSLMDRSKFTTWDQYQQDKIIE
tara:strand:+ start:141 stop:677 length:537 start_codon:yes stop_codon:yes gene_type:complete